MAYTALVACIIPSLEKEKIGTIKPCRIGNMRSVNPTANSEQDPFSAINTEYKRNLKRIINKSLEIWSKYNQSYNQIKKSKSKEIPYTVK